MLRYGKAQFKFHCYVNIRKLHASHSVILGYNCSICMQHLSAKNKYRDNNIWCSFFYGAIFCGTPFPLHFPQLAHMFDINFHLVLLYLNCSSRFLLHSSFCLTHVFNIILIIAYLYCPCDYSIWLYCIVCLTFGCVNRWKS